MDTVGLWTATLPLHTHLALALTASPTFPSVFGSTDAGALILGTFAPTASKATFRISLPSAPPTIVSATLATAPDGSVSLAGTWAEPHSGASGPFSATLVVPPPPAARRIDAGVYVGEAVPDPDLAPFCIPTNPIRWVLAQLPDAPHVFGAGFFDDAADVPGQPVIAFTVAGAWDADELPLVKRYEAADGVDMPTVAYTATYAADTLAGSWRNDAGGSYGAFTAARLPDSASFSTAAVLCSACAAVCHPGDIVAECTACPQPLVLCAPCAAAGAHGADFPSHVLEHLPVYAPEQVTGDSCAALVSAALAAFADRPFVYSPGGAVATYADVAAAAAPITAALAPHAPDGAVVVIGDMSLAYITAMVAAVAASVVVVPLDGALPHTSLAAVLAKVEPAALLLSRAYADALADVVDSALPLVVYDEQAGDDACTADSLPSPVRPPSAVAALLFTSGSTGTPKGAVYTEAMVLPSGGRSNLRRVVRLDFQVFHPSFVISMLAVMSVGGARALATDPATLLEQMRAARPTHISAPPLFFALLRKAYDARVAATGDAPAAAAYVRSCLGNRVSTLISGGGAIAPAMLAFFRTVIGVAVDDLFGSREAGPIAKNGEVYPTVSPAVLDDDGRPVALVPGARGVLAVASDRLIPAYFNDAEKTDAAFAMINGVRHYVTGDVVEVVSPPGPLSGLRIRLVGRAGYGVKLASAQWLAPSAVEAVLQANPWVEHVLVAGVASATAPVAIVVPSALAPPEVTPAEMLAELRFWSHHHHASPVVGRVALATGPWSHATGELTSTAKISRAVLHREYADVLERLFAELASPSPLDDANSGGYGDGAVVLSPPFAALLAEHTGVAVDAATHSVSAAIGAATLLELGGSSLALARLVGLLRNAGVELSIADAQAYSVAHLDAVASRARRSVGAAAALPPLARVRPQWPALVAAATAGMDALAVAERCGGRTGVFVTGATGFVGHAVVSALVAHPECGARTVYVLVRDVAKARAMGLEAYAQVRVLVGDLAQGKFGLSEAEYAEVVADVDAVVHAGAVVNMVLGYEAVAETNVGGTRRVVELAAAAGARLVHVSSVAVLPAAEFALEGWLPPPDSETLDGLGGYAASKTVAEHVVRMGAERGVDTVVVRLSAVSAGADGVANDADVLTHLLDLCGELGLGPRGGMSLDWFPVDIAADACVQLAISTAPLAQPPVFHLVGHGPPLYAALDAVPGCTARCEADEWREAARAALTPDHKSFALADILLHMSFSGAGRSAIPRERAHTVLAQLGIALPE